MKKSMLSGWSSIPGGILFFGDYVYMYTRVHALSRSTFGGACFSFGLDYIIAPWFFGLDQVSKSDIV